MVREGRRSHVKLNFRTCLSAARQPHRCAVRYRQRRRGLLIRKVYEEPACDHLEDVRRLFLPLCLEVPLRLLTSLQAASPIILAKAKISHEDDHAQKLPKFRLQLQKIRVRSDG